MCELPVGRGLYTIIDDKDLPVLSRHQWRVDRHLHVWRALWVRGADRYRRLALHRFLLGEPLGLLVDHVNGDHLDNRRVNLRVCTLAQNNQNRAPSRRRAVRGVKCVQLVRGRWFSYITIEGRQKNLGTFDSMDEAARAYDAAAVQYFGQFARLNFPAEVSS